MIETVTCKTCKYAKVSLFTLLASGYRFAKCSKHITEIEGHLDVVTGKMAKKQTEMPYCSIERGKFAIANDREKCGLDGKFWKPKHKKLLFTYLKRI